MRRVEIAALLGLFVMSPLMGVTAKPLALGVELETPIGGGEVGAEAYEGGVYTDGGAQVGEEEVQMSIEQTRSQGHGHGWGHHSGHGYYYGGGRYYHYYPYSYYGYGPPEEGYYDGYYPYDDEYYYYTH